MFILFAADGYSPKCCGVRQAFSIFSDCLTGCFQSCCGSCGESPPPQELKLDPIPHPLISLEINLPQDSSDSFNESIMLKASDYHVNGPEFHYLFPDYFCSRREYHQIIQHMHEAEIDQKLFYIFSINFDYSIKILVCNKFFLDFSSLSIASLSQPHFNALSVMADPKDLRWNSVLSKIITNKEGKIEELCRILNAQKSATQNQKAYDEFKWEAHFIERKDDCVIMQGVAKNNQIDQFRI